MMEYPEILLPRKSYKLKIELSVEDAQPLFIVRRSLKSKEETTNDLGSIRSHAFIDDDKVHLLYNLSCNLLGFFRKEHLIFSVGNDAGGEYWDNKDKIPSTAEIVFTIHENPCAIYLNVGKIYNVPFPHEKKIKNNIKKFEGTCNIVHMPLHGNYWHFEVEVIDGETRTKISANQKDWKQEAARHFIESYLKIHLNCNDVDGSVPESIFLEATS